MVSPIFSRFFSMKLNTIKIIFMHRRAKRMNIISGGNRFFRKLLRNNYAQNKRRNFLQYPFINGEERLVIVFQPM